ncbi:MAG TPA: hypothetical protein VH682_14100 [Gemmataceae bacterium]|jgi:hypothetical protein
MNVESLLVYAGVALGGWLLRHMGIGAGAKLPGVSTAPTPAAAVPATSHVPLLATLKADIDQIVKSAVEATVKQAIEDIKAAAAPLPQAK